MDTEKKIGIVEKIGGVLSTLLLGNTKETIVRMDERMQNLGKTMEEIKGNIKDLQVSINTHGIDIEGLRVHTKFGISNSPTVPNDEGRLLLSESGFFVQYPLLKEALFASMDSMGLRTLYDCEIGAFNALKQMQNDPLFDPLKDYAVNHPDVSLDSIFKVASWIIRDEYFRRISEKE